MVDYQAVADRFEFAFRVLTSNVLGARSIRVDHAAWHRAINYLRHDAAKANEGTGFMPDEEWQVLDLLHRHNLSMNWIYEGDVTLMILQLAEGTSSRQPPRLKVV
jgi:hypothetical protein